MLRLSKRIEYGLMAMQYLALSPAGASVSVREIAQRQGLPYELLAKIMQQLARRGLVRSRQGPQGGIPAGQAAAGHHAQRAGRCAGAGVEPGRL